MKKYRFTIFLENLDSWDINRLNCVKPEMHSLEKLLTGYTLNYEIPKRIITGSFKEKMNYRHSIFGTGCGPTIHKEVEVDWRETIYNMKVQAVRKFSIFHYKVSFSVKVTPKEAFIIGKALKERYYHTSYKCL